MHPLLMYPIRVVSTLVVLTLCLGPAQAQTLKFNNGHVYVEPLSARVGIGTTTPLDVLHVEGGHFRISQQGVALEIVPWYGGVNLRPHGNVPVYFGRGSTTPFDLYIMNGGGPNGTYTNAVFTGNGKVGIGTTEPVQDLHIASPNPVLTLQSTGSRGTWGDRADGYIEFRDHEGVRGGWMGFGAGWSDHFYITNARPGKGIGLATGGGEGLFVGGNGHVGIGTGRAEASHRLTVNGTVKAKEVLVSLDGWADHVFEDDYKLRPLSEVEAFIAEHGHLPEVPSEADVLEEGLQLGVMQARLLEKIEELTLYMIAQEKEVQALREENERLHERLACLEDARP